MLQPLRNFAKYLWVIIILTFVWGVIEYLQIFGISTKSPAYFVGLFLWGLAITVDFVSKGEIYVCASWTAPAGEYDNVKRLIGLSVGVSFMAASVYGYSQN